MIAYAVARNGEMSELEDEEKRLANEPNNFAGAGAIEMGAAQMGAAPIGGMAAGTPQVVVMMHGAAGVPTAGFPSVVPAMPAAVPTAVSESGCGVSSVPCEDSRQTITRTIFLCSPF